MLTHVLAIVGLSVMCVLWYVIQQWVARNMPDRPRGGCGGCGGMGGGGGGCHVDADSPEHASCSSEHSAH
jgi:hypothetical protein